jgi:hypothetical protein
LYTKIFYPQRAYIPHYYGDIVRGLFITIALAILVSSALYSRAISAALLLPIVGSMVLITLAALTNPHSKAIMRLNAVASGVGVVVFEVWALTALSSGTLVGFVLFEATAILFVFAFYFSMKTLRSMLMNLLGKEEISDEPIVTTGSSKQLFDDYGEPITDALGHVPPDVDDKGN